MLHTFAELCTYVHVLVDALDQLVAAPCDHRPGPRSAFSDSEVIALTLVAELVEMAEAAAFLAAVRRNHLALCPRLPARSRYHRRRRQLVEVANRIRGALPRLALGRLVPAERAL